MKIKDKILSETSEEVKQRVRDTANKLVMKEETLEEAAERITTNNFSPATNKFTKINIFKEGAKWQQERSYSDRNMKCFADFIRNGLLNTEYSCYKLDEHLEQWKQLTSKENESN